MDICRTLISVAKHAFTEYLLLLVFLALKRALYGYILVFYFGCRTLSLNTLSSRGPYMDIFLRFICVAVCSALKLKHAQPQRKKGTLSLLFNRSHIYIVRVRLSSHFSV